MSIRLNKITRDLNVGIQTVVSFLRKKGYEIEQNPNTKITDEQYELLVKEFSTDKNLKIESERFSQERQKEKKLAQEESNSHASHEIETVIDDSLRPHIKTVGKIDLNEWKKKPIEEKKAAEEKESTPISVPEPPASQPVSPKEEKAPEEKPEKETPATPEKVVETTPSEEPKKEAKEEEKPVPAEPEAPQAQPSETIFKLNTAKTPGVNVVGKIDLSAINQQTRPKKKSKEEKRKEREAKEKHIDAKHPVATSAPHSGTTENEGERRKRKRIKKEQRIDIEHNISSTYSSDRNNKTAPSKLKRPVKTEVNDEDVQKQIKETLARLTSKGQKKSAKWRKEKREAFSTKAHEAAEREIQESRILKLTEFVTANDLASLMNVPVNNVIATCMSLGIMVSINQRLDAETINIVAEEFGFQTEYVSAEVHEATHEEADREEDLVARPPIVTVMGHVDHGKTSLLDYIRNTNVIAGEAGGITQHIGAYNVILEDGRRITFLDTPGHEAFTAMRARGAKVTDIAIIIVAADDNVMPQTVEAINHASAAGVPIVFAINKIDKPNANPDKIKEALANMNYLVEDWGGKYQSQDISAKKGTGVKELMEKVLLEADILDLKANPNRRATGSIIESALDKGRGYVATVLVENGTLHAGDIVLAGSQFGRVKAMYNERNLRIKEAGPSTPVLILGLNGAPTAGDQFKVMESEQEAREIANKREQLQREQGLRTHKLLTLDDIGRRIAIGNFQELNIIVKGDVDGSVEALSDSLIKLSTEEIQVNVLHKAVGQVSESDVALAAASNAIIVAFQVRPSMAARKLAEKEGVDIRLYSIIYNAIEEVKAAMEGMLSPEIKEEITATVEVRE
ncbi:MAG: translation initiation factor IF-2, partial [Porphyromonadaceae bacterium]|nr:translation initiation factor IF-2 [Porphyromonadaceae bacterium]